MMGRAISRDGQSRAVPHLLIVGGGPAGLSAAYEASKSGAGVTVIEILEQVGGLARTLDVDGNRYDVGPHRFLTVNPEVRELFVDVAGRDLIQVSRMTRILYNDHLFSYPLTPLNALLGVGFLDGLRILASYVCARMRRWGGITNVESFEDWVVDRFGRRLFECFFKTYTEKVWGVPCARIGADWASQRIKGLSLGAALANAVLKRGPAPKTLADEFLYLRRGTGQFYEKLAQHLSDMGADVHLGCAVERIISSGNLVTAVVLRHADGQFEQLPIDQLLFSAPLTDLVQMVFPAAPADVLDACRRLRYRNHICVNLPTVGTPFPDNWIYIHSSDLRRRGSRITATFPPRMAASATCSPLTVEYFCFEQDDLWQMPDAELILLAKHELAAAGLVEQGRTGVGFVVRSEKAYPVIEIGHSQHVERIRGWIAGFQNLWVIGRSGMFKYNNQDHAIATGMLAARTALGLGSYDPWLVNIDAEYHEGAIAE